MESAEAAPPLLTGPSTAALAGVSPAALAADAARESARAAFARARVLLLMVDAEVGDECRRELRELCLALASGRSLEDALKGGSRALAPKGGSESADPRRLSTILVSTFEPELFDPDCNPFFTSAITAMGPSYEWCCRISLSGAFQCWVIALLVAFCSVSTLFLSGVGGLAVKVLIPVMWVATSLMAFPLMTHCSVRVLRLTATSYYVWYPALLNVLTIPVALAYKTLEQRVFTGVLFFLMLFMPAVDSFKGRQLVWQVFLIMCATSVISAVLTEARIFSVQDVSIEVLGGQVAVLSRMVNTQFAWSILYARKTILAYIYPDRFCTVPKARLATVPRAASTVLLIAAAKTRLRAIRNNNNSTGSSSAVAPSVALPGAELEAASAEFLAALRASAGAVVAEGWPDAARLVEGEALSMLHESAGGGARHTVDVSRVLRVYSTRSGIDDVQMLLPVFQPTLVQEEDTLGAVLGMGSVWARPRSAAARAALCAAWPLSMLLTGAALCGGLAASTALAVVLPTTLASAARLLCCCRAIVRLALQDFNMWYCLGTTLVAGSAGCALLLKGGAGELSTLWALQLAQLVVCLLSDALPSDGGRLSRAERLAFFPAFALLCAVCTWLLHSGAFPGKDVRLELGFLGAERSIWQVGISTQFQLLTLMLRFTYRAVATRDCLVVCDGLRKVKVTAQEARVLKLTGMMSEQPRGK